MEYEKRNLDERFEREGEAKCICGHWSFTHKLEFRGLIFTQSYHTWCKDCKCENFTIPDTTEGNAK